MNSWPATILPTTKANILEFCVNDRDWQDFRMSLKGMPTTYKLDKLWDWRCRHVHLGIVPIKTRTQVDNYLNALLRGGQLNSYLEVQR